MSAGCFLFSAISVISAHSPVLEPTSPLLDVPAGPVVVSPETAPVLLEPPLLLSDPPVLPPAPPLELPLPPPLPVGSWVVLPSPPEAVVTEVAAVTVPEMPAV